MDESRIEDLRPSPVELDASYSSRTLATITASRPARSPARAWLAAAAVVAILGGAGFGVAALLDGEGRPTGAADCVGAVRFDGRVYRQIGYTTGTIGRSLGRADVAECRDRGSSSDGPFFPPAPTREPVFELPALLPGSAVATRLGDGTSSVYVTDPLTDEQIEAVLARLDANQVETPR